MNIIRSLALGVLAALGAMVAESLFSLWPGFASPETETSMTMAVFFYIIVFAFVEESLKLAMIVKNFRWIGQGNVIFLSSLVGVGFAALEIFFHLLGLEKISDILDHRYLMPAVMHTLTALFMGYLLNKNARKKEVIYIQALAVSAAVHIIYNLSVIQ